MSETEQSNEVPQKGPEYSYEPMGRKVNPSVTNAKLDLVGEHVEKLYGCVERQNEIIAKLLDIVDGLNGRVFDLEATPKKTTTRKPKQEN